MIPPKAPQYRIPLYRLLQAGFYMVRGQPRNLGADFRFLRKQLPLAPRFEGTEHLPETGPYLLAANHYERAGLWMAWSGMAVANAVYRHADDRLRWIAIAEWDDYKVGPIPIPNFVTREVFARFFTVFGFIAMEPPTAGARLRAEGVRRAMQAMKDGDVVGIFPEGDIGETSAMIPAQAGAGGFMLALSRLGPVVPVGLFEREGRLCITFGSAIHLDDIHTLPRSERDLAAAGRIMTSVARLLPNELRGAYAAVSPTGLESTEKV